VKTALLGLLAETFIHPGTGQSDETVDLPVARERTTGYPFIPGSSCKGALREIAMRDAPDSWEQWFGRPEHSGQVMVSDARLLLLPVRSLTGAYRWLTCPYLIERLIRDRARASLPATATNFGFGALNGTDDVPVIASGSGRLFLEERSFTIVASPKEDLVALLGNMIADVQARARLNDQLAVIRDGDFGWFARYALSIQARNCLNDEKISTNLWYEETIPPDTVMYLILGDRYDTGESSGCLGIAGLFQSSPYLQMGGNETVGQGWFMVRPLLPEVAAGTEG
jgi:CRISPR-associated protein Cmr4